ncbi:HWE histidine kinase domain-containing protein [Methylobacterium sp. E-045]|uniref:sensor histidine kinase n=1 Tax=Methylobacterium sp. E-045 TaxID=2836575 RepID=UPI001FB8B440|nr:HWE histidine kinase domain-containing protein [Methylobacterium sp. E-045]MCJ2130194.1 PAS domain-containing protein [Methylobacterium sp. E-045]
MPGDARPQADPYRRSFDEAGIGLVILDGGTDRILDANPHLTTLLGYEAGSLTGRAVTILGDGPDLLSAGIRSWITANGSRLDVRIRTSPSSDTEALRTLVVERVDTDEIVRSEENRSALTAAGLGEWRLDLADGLLRVSRRAAHILGVPPGTSLTWTQLSDLMDAPEAEKVKTTIRAAIRDRAPFAIETRLRRAGDSVAVRISARGQAIAATGDRPGIVVGVLQDVTTRLGARDALRESEERLRIATSLAELGIFEWHMLDDQAVWENERMFAIFGRRSEEGALGKREFLGTVLHPDDRPAFRRAISMALRDDSTLQASGRIQRSGDGAWRIIDMAGRFESDAPDRLPRRLIGVVADVTERRIAEERQALLIRELHHRVKNTLATVQAIVGSTARTASSIESFYEAFVGRIMSLAHTHSVLTEDAWQTASLRNLLENELRPYGDGASDAPGARRIVLDGPPVDLASEVAVPIGMAIHELTTNAAKHGALSTQEGRVAIVWSVTEDAAGKTLHLDWSEFGGPRVRPPTRQGFGSRLLQRVLTAQVRADIAASYPPEGFRLTMRAPLPARTEGLNPLA